MYIYIYIYLYGSVYFVPAYRVYLIPIRDIFMILLKHMELIYQNHKVYFLCIHNILKPGTPKFPLNVSLKIVSTSHWIDKIFQKNIEWEPWVPGSCWNYRFLWIFDTFPICVISPVNIFIYVLTPSFQLYLHLKWNYL